MLPSLKKVFMLYLLVFSSEVRSHDLHTKQLIEVSCCDDREDGHTSCLEENSNLISILESSRGEYSHERYVNIEESAICRSNTTVEITFGIDENINTTSLEFQEKLNGSVLAENYLLYEKAYYSPQDYCVISADAENVTLKLCKPDCNSDSEVCVSKCCPWGENLQIISNGSSRFSCVPSQEKHSLNPVIYSDDVSPIEETSKLKLSFNSFNFSCAKYAVSESRKFNLTLGHHGRVRLLKNGKLRTRLSKWNTYTTSSYCLENLNDDTEIIVALVCSTREIGNLPPIVRKLLAVVNVAEAVFTMLTTLTYLLLWKMLANVHRLTQFFHVSSYGLLLIFKFIFLSMHTLYGGTLVCKLIGIALHYLVLSTGSWMVLINWDLFLTFWKIRAGNSRGTKRRRILLYCLFGWGFPFLLVVIGLTMDGLYISDDSTALAIPEYGKYTCLPSHWALYYYAFIPVGIDYFAVVTLFIITTIIIYKHKESTKFASENATTRRKIAKRLSGGNNPLRGLTGPQREK